MSGLEAGLLREVAAAWPLKKAPLVQCITNEITCESLANALLYVDAKPVMADDIREFDEFFAQNDAVLLNLGHITDGKEQALQAAARYAAATGTPAVVDLVGVAATRLRYDLAWQLWESGPQVIKGNLSEMRRFCGLSSAARGVDGNAADQEAAALAELAAAMQEICRRRPLLLLATGPQDLVVTANCSLKLANGVPQLDRFTGTGDIVGSLIAALLGEGLAPLPATVAAVSYFNLCGEAAAAVVTGKGQGLAAFRQETLDRLSLLMKDRQWWQKICGEEFL